MKLNSKKIRIIAAVMVTLTLLSCIAFASESSKEWYVDGFVANGSVSISSSGASAATSYGTWGDLDVEVISYYKIGGRHYSLTNNESAGGYGVSTSVSFPSGVTPIEATGVHSVNGSSSVSTYMWY